MRSSWLTVVLGLVSVLVLIPALAIPLPGQVVPPPATSTRAVVVPFAGSYLGIGIREIPADRAKALQLPEEAGVEITRVGADSPAERAGLKVGDIVLRYNGMKVEGMEQFARLVRETPVGREARLDIFRNGAAQTVAVKLGQRPPIPGFPGGLGTRLPDVPRPFPGMQSPLLGVEAEPVDGQLAQYFGVSEGVLVRSVMRGSPAERAGIKAGDVLVRIDDAKVVSPFDITRRLRSVRGRPLAVALMRDHRELTLTVEIPAARSGRAEPVRVVNGERE